MATINFTCDSDEEITEVITTQTNNDNNCQQNQSQQEPKNQNQNPVVINQNSNLQKQLDEIKKACPKSNLEGIEFDEQLLIKLIEIQKQEIKKLQGQSVIAMFGVTGAGKSSTICSAFEVAEYKKLFDENDCPYYQYVFKNEVAKTAQSDTKSQTLFAQSIKTPLSFYNKFQKDMYFLDLPGTLDNRGFEVEISNLFMVSTTLRSCQQIKPILVLNANEFKTQKMESIKKTLKIVCGLIDIEKYGSTISIFITQEKEYKVQDDSQFYYKKNFNSLLQSFEEQYQQTQLPEDFKVISFLQNYINNYSYNFPFFVYIDQQQNAELLQNYLFHNFKTIDNPSQAILQGQVSYDNLQKFKQFCKAAEDYVKILIYDVSDSNLKKICQILEDLKIIESYLKLQCLQETQQKCYDIILNFTTNQISSYKMLFDDLRSDEFSNNIKSNNIKELQDFQKNMILIDQSNIFKNLIEIQVNNQKFKKCLDLQYQFQSYFKDAVKIISQNVEMLIKGSENFIQLNFQKSCYQLIKLWEFSQWDNSFTEYYQQSLQLCEQILEDSYQKTLQLITNIFNPDSYNSAQEKSLITNKFYQLEQLYNKVDQIQNSFINAIQTEKMHQTSFIQDQKQKQSLYTKQLGYIDSINDTIKEFLDKSNVDFRQKIESIQIIFQQTENQLGNQSIQENTNTEHDLDIEDNEDDMEMQSEQGSLNEASQKYSIPKIQYFLIDHFSRNKFLNSLVPQENNKQENKNILEDTINQFIQFIQKLLQSNDTEIVLKNIYQYQQELFTIKHLLNILDTSCSQQISNSFIELSHQISIYLNKLGKSLKKILTNLSPEDEANYGKNVNLDKFFQKYGSLQSLQWIDDIIKSQGNNVTNTVSKADEAFNKYLNTIKNNFQTFLLDFMKDINDKDDLKQQLQIKEQIQNLVDLSKNLNSFTKKSAIMQAQSAQGELLLTVNQSLENVNMDLQRLITQLQQDISDTKISFKNIELYIEALNYYKQITLNFGEKPEQSGFKKQIQSFFKWYKTFLKDNYYLKIIKEISSFNFDDLPEDINYCYIQDENKKFTIYEFLSQQYKSYHYIQQLQVQCPQISKQILDESELMQQVDDQISLFLEQICESYDNIEKYNSKFEDFHKCQKYMYLIKTQFEKIFKKYIDRFAIPNIEDPQKILDQKQQDIFGRIKNLINLDTTQENINENILVTELKKIQQKDKTLFDECIEQAIQNYSFFVEQKIKQLRNFNNWVKNVKSNFEGILKLQPYVLFFGIFNLDHKHQGISKKIKEEFEKQLQEKENIIKYNIQNYQIKQAYEHLEIMIQLIELFSSYDIESCFLIDIQDYKDKQILIQKVFVEEIQNQIGNINNQEQHFIIQEIDAKKTFEDINSLMQQNQNKGLLKSLSQFQLCYLKKYVENLLKKLEKDILTQTLFHNKYSKYQKLINKLEKLEKMCLQAEDQEYLENIIEKKKEELQELNYERSVETNNFKQNLLKLDKSRLINEINGQKYNKEDIVNEFKLQIDKDFQYLCSFDIEDTQYQDSDQIQIIFSRVKSCIEKLIFLSPGEQSQYDKKIDEITISIMEKLLKFIKPIMQQILKKNDFTFTNELEIYITYITSTLRMLNNEGFINDQTYQNFSTKRNQIQNQISKNLSELTTSFQQKIDDGNQFLEVKNIYEKMQNSDNLCSKLNEIILQGPNNFITKELKEIVKTYIQKEQRQKIILDICKKNNKNVMDSLKQYNSKRIIKSLKVIQNINVLSSIFKEESQITQDIVNGNNIKYFIEEFKNKLKDQCQKAIQDQLFNKDLETSLKQLQVLDESIKQFPQIFQNQDDSYSDCISMIKQLTQEQYRQYKQQIKDAFYNQEDIYELKKPFIDPMIKRILDLYKIQDVMKQTSLKKDLEQKVEDLLSLVNQNLNDDLFLNFGQRLIEIDGQYGQEITQEFSVFSELQAKNFVEKTKTQNQDYAINNFKFQNSEKINDYLNKTSLFNLLPEQKDRLKNLYQTIDQNFNQTIKCYYSLNLNQKLDENDIKQQIFDFLQKLKQAQKNQIIQDKMLENVCDSIGYFLGKLFSLWSLLDKKKQKKKQSSLRKPHPVQIITICVMLDLHKQQEKQYIFFSKNWYTQFLQKGKFSSQIIEILTGQGKSITLGMVSLILALLGYTIKVACYSKYLSQRDYDDFENIFDFLDIPKDQIIYGTYSTIIEKYLNRNGDIRQMAKNYFKNQQEQQTKIPNQSQNENRPIVLLIDEIDQFFSEYIYGRAYNPVTGLEIPQSYDLFKYIWDNRNDDNLEENVKKLTLYKTILEQNDILKNVISSQISKICFSVSNIQQHYNNRNPQVSNGQIGYKIFDSICTQTSFNYFTTFAYFKEHEQDPQQITLDKVKERSKFTITLGSFSYAQLPLDMNLENIMGVTGTLVDQDLKVFEYFKDYGIKKLTFAPSIYSVQPPTFRQETGFKIHSDKLKWFSNLYAATLNAYNDGGQPSIIFFEKESDLNEYKQYLMDEGKYDINAYQILTQDYEDQYESIIRNATKKQMITLSIQEFGRGVDFKCYDNQIDKLGGFLVIMAFLSDNVVEEIQIRGRTGRNGQQGEIQYHLLESELTKKFNITNEQIQQWQSQNKLYKEVDYQRRTKYTQTLEKQKKRVEKLKDNHEISKNLQEAFQNNNHDDILYNLELLNK